MLDKKIYKNNQENMKQYPNVAKWCNENNAHIEDKGEYYIVAENIIEEHIPTTEEQISALKAELATYDYIGTKIAMGVATKTEYKQEIAYTQELRAKINELQDSLEGGNE